ncbi:hypothetical protein Ga0100231_011830 [Opitutaceae bacterium TAV4]|nr:hypothetical protein Ga0100231_011830 [Opitutaceae bacterium TAV4]RRJ98925.1 hypothetical protein Ga0100230_011540 [Opitutaceae bacterium TAV3]
MKPDYDTKKVDDAVLALLWLTAFSDSKDSEGNPLYYRAWKGHDWGAMERLHAAGYIDNPVSKTKSVVFTKEGAERSAALFRKLFVQEDEHA